jgi:hypothetical protein
LNTVMKFGFYNSQGNSVTVFCVRTLLYEIRTKHRSPKRDEVGNEGTCLTRNVVICISCPLNLRIVRATRLRRDGLYGKTSITNKTPD